MNAYKFYWPGAELKGCFFHFNQAILTWAFRNGCKLPYSIKTNFKVKLKIILLLPVITAHLFIGAWTIIKNNLPSDLNVQTVIDYFNSVWLRNI